MTLVRGTGVSSTATSTATGTGAATRGATTSLLGGLATVAVAASVAVTESCEKHIRQQRTTDDETASIERVVWIGELRTGLASAYTSTTTAGGNGSLRRSGAIGVALSGVCRCLVDGLDRSGGLGIAIRVVTYCAVC